MHIKDVVFVFHLHDPEDLRWHGRSHHHGPDEYELHYFLEGDGSFINQDSQFRLKSGSLFISPPFVRHQILADRAEQPISYYAVLMQLDERDIELAELLSDGIGWKRPVDIGDRHRFFFEDVREKALSGDARLQKSGEYQVMAFLYSLAAGPREWSAQGESGARIEQALKIMQKSVFKSLSLGDIAGQLNVSQEHFIRLFKKHMNSTPMKYMTRLKIEAATSMLISSDTRIYRIAQQLHFHSEFHFSRVFKQHTGVSPRQYRVQYRQFIGQRLENQSIIYLVDH